MNKTELQAIVCDTFAKSAVRLDNAEEGAYVAGNFCLADPVVLNGEFTDRWNVWVCNFRFKESGAVLGTRKLHNLIAALHEATGCSPVRFYDGEADYQMTTEQLKAAHRTLGIRTKSRSKGNPAALMAARASKSSL